MNYADIMQQLSADAKAELTFRFRQHGMIADDPVPSFSTMRFVYESLDPLARRTLSQITRSFGCRPFSEAQLLETATGLTTAEKRVGVTLLRQAGVVFAARKSWGETVLFLPFDLAPAWHALCREGKIGLPEMTAAVSSVGAKTDSFFTWLFVFLAEAAKSKLPLSRQRTLYKQDSVRLNKLICSTPGETLSEDFAGWGNPAYPQPLAAVMQTALDLGLLQETDGNLSVPVDIVKAWLKQPQAQLENELLNRWLVRVMLEEASLQHALYVMLSLPENRWFAVRALAAVMIDVDQRADLDFAAPQLEEQISRRLIEPLITCGWLDTGMADDGAFVCRWRIPRHIPLGSGTTLSGAEPVLAAGNLYVQSDLEIIAPPDVSFAVRWELEKFAARKETDLTWTYRIGKESLFLAYSNGLRIDAILALLAEHGAGELPVNVRDALWHWWNDFSRVEIVESLLVRCAFKQDMDMLAAKLEGVGIRCERLGEHVIAFAKEELAAVNGIMQKAGFSTAAVAGFPGRSAKQRAVADAGSPATETNGDDKRKRLLPFGKIDMRQPAVQDAYPELHRIPQRWLNEARSYHHSTAKQLLQTAISWGAYVRMKFAEQEALLIPEEIAEACSGWEVVGRVSDQEVRISPESWNELQLILPGINDKYML